MRLCLVKLIRNAKNGNLNNTDAVPRLVLHSATELEAETYVPERSACGQGAAWAPERSRITTRETTRERLTDL